MKKTLKNTVVIIGLLSLTACSNMDARSQRMLSGAAVGAAAGITTTYVLGGCISCGAAMGAVAGTAAGYVIDTMQNN